MSYSYLEYAHLPAGRRSRLAALTQRSAGRLAILEAGASAPGAEPSDPHLTFHLASEAIFSGVATSLGIAHTYFPDYAELVPLVLDLNGSFSAAGGTFGGYALQATVEDALRLDARAVRFTVDLDGNHALTEMDEFRTLRAEAHRYDLPVILRAPAATGSQGAPAAPQGSELPSGSDLAAAALHLGADMVELPTADFAADLTDGREEREAAWARTVRVVAMLPVLAHLDAQVDASAVLRAARAAMDHGCVGVVADAALFGRSYQEALALGRRLQEELTG